jgi:hypothetical protein
MKIIKITSLAAVCLLLISCGGGGAVRDVLDAIGVKTLTAGQSITISANQVVLVPAGTTVRAPNAGNATVISGNKANIEVPAGSTVTVPSAPVGEADNTVRGI